MLGKMLALVSVATPVAAQCGEDGDRPCPLRMAYMPVDFGLRPLRGFGTSTSTSGGAEEAEDTVRERKKTLI